MEKSKESLLEAELRLIREINSLRRNQMSGRETLDQVLELLEQINFQPRPFPDQNQATLEKPMRPVEGPVLANNARLVAQPGPGLWLEAGPDGNVVAPLGGKVVYNDGIKGLGQVLILSHGQNTLGVYANLAQCPLRLGQDLVRGELMGRAGPYRGGTGRALYLELRFQEKPINPTEWFATNP